MDLDILGACIFSFTISFVAMFLEVFTLHSPAEEHCLLSVNVMLYICLSGNAKCLVL